ncbi:alpha/beta hydrolase [Methylocaldum sp.]|uniref:alpha/beta hydrolase n=1 Tax=Methylocaldum sp. TaxID=1969727 RepID=UPI002D4CFEA0|nr:alpha/beta hydrolase [Methylocaldum sp.]HYE37142.1 alpha/beta hydrolase [Methylocaldum sp.]
MPRRFFQNLLFIPLALSLSGCANLLFYPDRAMRLTPDVLGLKYEDVNLTASDGTRLHGWFLLADGEPRGTVFFLHGNAQNISTHIRSVAWLPETGYQVFLLDYRGYGLSEGSPGLPEVLTDVAAGFQWLLNEPRVTTKNLFVLGQSLGANLAAYFAGANPEVRHRLSAMVLDAPFASYREITREKLSQLLITWPLQYPLSWLMPDDYSPIKNIAELSPLPLLIICSETDEIVPAHHSIALFKAASEPKSLWLTQGFHIATFGQEKNRRRVLSFLKEHER